VQDFNPEVQRLINRRQSEDQVAALTTLARITGFTSINFDLVYGLPKQTVASILETVQKVVRLRPDRIAFYSYAHVPWMRPGQRAYTEADLPQGAEKRALYEHARALLELAGYIEIGLDHFALPADELKRASDNGKLHRNFMGYTEKHTGLLLGLGVSSISDAGTMLMQNVKDVKSWNAAIDAGVLPMLRGHKLTAEDLILRRHILNIMCRDSTSWENDADRPECFGEIIERLQPLCDDGLIILSPGGLVVQPKGKPFLRNIGSCFDARMMKEKPASSLFSRTA
jgi:oxygen-independent coproporphyrinogen III oxidase